MTAQITQMLLSNAINDWTLTREYVTAPAKPAFSAPASAVAAEVNQTVTLWRTAVELLSIDTTPMDGELRVERHTQPNGDIQAVVDVENSGEIELRMTYQKASGNVQFAQQRPVNVSARKLGQVVESLGDFVQQILS